MAAIAGIPPRTLRDILVSKGWTLIDETENVWVFADPTDQKSPPLPIPKHGDVVDPEVMDWVCHKDGLSRTVMDAVRKQASTTP